MYKLLAGLALVGLIAGTSCRTTRSTKKIQTAMANSSNHRDTTGDAAKAAAAPARDLHADSLAFISHTLDTLRSNYIDFQSFSGKLKVHYTAADGKDNDLTVYIHIKKDSAIWISIHATALNIEAFRMLVTPDSVKILDKIKKVVTLRSVSYLQSAAHLPLDFGALQALLVGNPVFLDTTHIVFYKQEANNGVSLFSSGPVFRNFMTLNSDGTLQHVKLDDADPLRSRTGDITYGDYDRQPGARPFSQYRKIAVAEKGKVDIEMSYKQYRFNEDLQFPFSVPKNYKRK